jgi:hypothetical protein
MQLLEPHPRIYFFRFVIPTRERSETGGTCFSHPPHKLPYCPIIMKIGDCSGCDGVAVPESLVNPTFALAK